MLLPDFVSSAKLQLQLQFRVGRLLYSPASHPTTHPKKVVLSFNFYLNFNLNLNLRLNLNLNTNINTNLNLNPNLNLNYLPTSFWVASLSWECLLHLTMV